MISEQGRLLRQDGLGWRWQFLFCLVAALAVVSRKPDVLLNPQFWAEEGTMLFAQAYNLGWLHSLAIPQAGYLHTFPRLIAAASLLLPIRLAPLLMNFTGLILQVLPVAVLLSARGTAWGTLPVRFVYSALYVALPNSWEVNVNLTCAQFHLTLLTLLLLLSSPPKSASGKVFDILIVLSTGMTGPFAILLLPISLVFWWVRRYRWTMVVSAILAICALVQAFTLLTYHGPGARPNSVTRIKALDSTLPITAFPPELAEMQPDVVILTLAMGAPDASAAMRFFQGHAGRVVLLSSGDVYRAYGVLTGMESGPINNAVLTEDSPVRSVLFPYRHKAVSSEALEYWYEKILAERAVLHVADLPGVVLRLPKVYGSESNRDLATVYRYSHHPSWRWTHGYVENVAAAVVLGATHASAGGRTYNVGEAATPTVAERLAWLPPCSLTPDWESTLDFRQDMAYDTGTIRKELGFTELIPEREAALLTLQSRTF